MENSWTWLFQFIGRLHVLVVHFPIALLVVAIFLEGLTLRGKRPGLREGINWMIYLGTLFAVLAAILGWSLRTFDDYSGSLVDIHQNLGICTAVLSVVTALLLQATTNGKISNYLAYRLGLILTVISLVVTGHLGASITHGEDYLTSVLPGNKVANDNSEATMLLSELSQHDTLTLSQLDDLNLGIRAILAHNCYQCHSENKQKGKLSLDSKRGVFQGGTSGLVIAPGNPGESELYRRISLPSNHKDIMPKKGNLLSENEIVLIELWIDKGAHWSDRPLQVFHEAPLSLIKPELPNYEHQEHPLDKLVHAYFEENSVDWPEIVDDQTFVRRAYLDIVGLLPLPGEVDQFVLDQTRNKREILIDVLLNDDHNYTQHWLSFWNDLLRNDYSGTGFITGGRKQITDWLYKSLQENKPYDLMVRELVNPTDESEGFIKGIEWRGVVNSSQSTEMQAAQNVGQSLLGVNVKCASCHNSFVSNLTLEQSYGFAAVFAESTLELNRCDKPIGKMAQASFLYPQLGSVEAAELEERLLKLADVITKRENGRLYRTITNRIWKRLMGRGIIEPVDEMDNIPWNAALLDWLAADFIDSGYDLKHLIKKIMTSKTYQLSSVGYKKPHDVTSDSYVFTGPVTRRMSAEQFSDVVSQVIAPVYYAAAFEPEGEGLSSRRIWHPEVKFDRSVLPDPGKRYFRHVFTSPEEHVAGARVLISVDDSYTLYLNGKKISEGSDWRKVNKIDVGNFIIPGRNIIAIEGINDGKIANPAGILFALKMSNSNGKETLIEAGKNWKSTDTISDESWIDLAYDDNTWGKVKDYGSSNWDKPLDYKFANSEFSFARASLVKQHQFLKILGRPSRENVATTRDDQATLLQALELTNGEYFTKVLEEGAGLWLNQYGSNNELIAESLYQRSLGRKPSPKEKKVMLETLGDQPNKEALQDLFWSVLILPEFQFIH